MMVAVIRPVSSGHLRLMKKLNSQPLAGATLRQIIRRSCGALHYG
jgi:hypothetical protein